MGRSMLRPYTVANHRHMLSIRGNPEEGTARGLTTM